MILYSAAAKAARMEAVRQLLDGGSLEILSGQTVLVSIRLAAHVGSVKDATLTLSQPYEGAYSRGSGAATEARLCDAAGEPVVIGLTVGKGGTDVALNEINFTPGLAVTIAAPMRLTHG